MKSIHTKYQASHTSYSPSITFCLLVSFLFVLLFFFPPLFPPFFTGGSTASDHSPAMKLEVAFGGKVGHGVQYTVH